MSPLGCPFLLFHLLILPNIFYLLLSSINLSCPLLHFTLLLLLFCTCSFFLLFSAGIDFCCISRMDFSFIISSFLLSFSSTFYHTSYFPIYILTLPYISLVILCWIFLYSFPLLVILLLLFSLYYILSWILL